MGLMATINLIAIVLLSGTVLKLTKDYFEQRKAGQEPTSTLIGLATVVMTAGNA